MNIAKETPVAEIASSWPGSLKVLERHGIDYCCGGSKSLGEACREKGIAPEQLLAEIETERPSPDSTRARAWTTATASELIAHILEKHHGYLRAELPRLTQLLAKVLEAHGAKHGESLRPLRDVFTGLREELEQHMAKEENILFPVIQQVERAQIQGGSREFRGMSVSSPIWVMEQEHESAGNALRQMRRLTADFTLPEDGCQTYRTLLDGLKTLEADLHEHIHLENNILFPKAVALEGSL